MFIPGCRRLAMMVVFPTVLLMTACGGGGGGDVSSTSSPGIHSLVTAGGDGGENDGYGGLGGAIEIIKEGGTGDVAVLSSGEVDASFPPSSLTPDSGVNPLVIQSDTLVSVAATEPAVGIPYLQSGKEYIYISDGNGTLGNEPRVTGLVVDEGATLTLELNSTLDSSVEPAASLIVTNDIDNRGTITTVDSDPTQRGHLVLKPFSYFGTGTLDTSAIQEGQSGGDVYLYATGDIVNRGAIHTLGADSSVGTAGYGGDVEMYTNGIVENSADIVTAGGRATSSVGYGGDGGYVDMVGYTGLNNAGDMNANGGNGHDGGGSGGWIWLEVYSEGDLRNSGNFTTVGGTAQIGAGGDGGEIDAYAYGGGLYSSGSMTTDGGDTDSTVNDAGNGNYINLGVFPSDSLVTPPGDLSLTGSLSTAGGSVLSGGQGNGGSGGLIGVYIANYSELDPMMEQEQRLRLFNYKTLDTRGGHGNFGGSGGNVDIISDFGYDNPGNLVNEASVVTRGGDAVPNGMTIPAFGGKGGDVYIEAYADDLNDPNPQGTKVLNRRGINAVGGSNLEFDGDVDYWWAGSGGYVFLTGADSVNNSGAIAAYGGNDSGDDGGATGYGGSGGVIYLFSGRDMTNSGQCDVAGGNGEYRGGDGGEIYAVGNLNTSNNGIMIADGGMADSALFGAVDGDDGTVYVAP
jgi:hypothetical protein